MKKLKMGVIMRLKDDQYYLAGRYLDYLRRHDIIPVLITPHNEALLPQCDGVLFAGGVDINPERYGADNHGSQICDELDQMEFELLNLVQSLALPIMGICRGLQLLNVYFGGTLEQNITGHMDETHPVINQRRDLFTIAEVTINSYHHQAIEHLGQGLESFLITPDGVIEGIINETKRIIAVQYHPEYDDPLSIMQIMKRFMQPRRVSHIQSPTAASRDHKASHSSVSSAKEPDPLDT